MRFVRITLYLPDFMDVTTVCASAFGPAWLDASFALNCFTARRLARSDSAFNMIQMALLQAPGRPNLLIAAENHDAQEYSLLDQSCAVFTSFECYQDPV